MSSSTACSMHEVPLFYQYQSGAINESLSDIFGELFDLAEPSGTDTAATRWLIGEDTPRGAFRDMQDPPRFGHPDRVRSPRWHRSAADDGGVHRNSGVGNKAAALIADGGTFRGQAVAGIGEERTARIFYQAITSRLTPAANYLDLADALVAACTDLAGSAGLTMAHCASVRDATQATQMHLDASRAGAEAGAAVRSGSTSRGRLRRRPGGPRRGTLGDPAPGGHAQGLVLPPEPQRRPGLGWHLGVERADELLRARLRQFARTPSSRPASRSGCRRAPSCTSGTATPSTRRAPDATTAASWRSGSAAARGGA